jgi:hypothetical protein
LETEINVSRSWFRHGILNTLEHVVTRAADAATTLVLLWVLSPEVFSKLALAQALVAPLLVFFIAPETVIYRDFHQWKTGGVNEIASRLHAFRTFAWGKAQLALVLSLLLAIPSSDFKTRFFSLLWAFSLALGPQISGPDREFLRVDLRLGELNLISLYQKVSLLAGTVFVAVVMHARIDALAIVAAVSALTTAVLARSRVKLALGNATIASGSTLHIIRESIQSFSIWQHLSGVVLSWVQTMDLFYLGMFRYPARTVGLYAASLKLANFSFALPLAMTNLFSIWVVRRAQEPGHQRELSELRKLSGALFGGTLIQALVLAILSPFLFRFISHGRWEATEQATMIIWFKWILSGGVLFCSSFLISSWLAARASVAKLLTQVYLPWLVFAAALYAGAASLRSVHALAIANLPVAVIYVFLLVRYLWSHRRSLR